MTAARYRAWQFVHPDLEAFGAAGAGLQVAPTGRISVVDEEASVRQAILLLLSTRPGERVMRPTYGCDLHRLIFSPNDDTTAGLAIFYVQQALERWEPRIQVLNLDAGRSAIAPNQMDIWLEYRLKATLQVDSLAVSINLAGE